MKQTPVSCDSRNQPSCPFPSYRTIKAAFCMVLHLHMLLWVLSTVSTSSVSPLKVHVTRGLYLWGISWLFWRNPLTSSFYIGGLWLPPELWKWKLKFQLKAGDETRTEWMEPGPWCWQLGLRLGLYWISAGPYVTAGLALLGFLYAFEIR